MNPPRRCAGRATVVTAVVFMASACIPRIDEMPINGPSRPTEPPRTTVEHQEPPPDVGASLAGNRVTVTVQQRGECRTVTTTVMERDEGVERRLRHGTLGQGVNLASAAALLGIGIATYAAAAANACNDSATAIDPYAVSTSCSAQQQQEQVHQNQTLGIVVSSLAVVPIGIFVWAFSARATIERRRRPLLR